MRTLKEPHVRREEIMDAAAELFSTHGIESTSVNAIIQRIGVAKGTFYWYFESKDELLDALVARENDRYVREIGPIVDNQNLDAIEKLRRLFGVHRAKHKGEGKIHDYFHRPENAAAHQKHIVREIQMLAPILAGVITQGVAEGLFDTCYPREAVEFMMLAIAFMVAPSVLPGNRDEQASRLRALQDILERALGAESGMLDFLSTLAFAGRGVRQ